MSPVEKRSPEKPSSTTKTPVVKNPSTPGIQKPGNKPDGRDAAEQGETRSQR